ncbi:MAG: sigma-70 family RNA polymerase sigma factor [Anaerolineae bacterium]
MSDLTNPFDEMDAVSALLNDGLEQGYITYDQILETLPEVENNLMLLETIMEEAQAAGIPIYENNEEAKAEIDVNGDNGFGDPLARAGTFFRRSRDDSPHVAPLFDLSNVPIDDSVGLYFREMGQQQLLTADEEIQLAMEIEAGRMAHKKMNRDDISEKGRDRFANIEAVGDAARAHLIRANTRLVVSIAKKYRGRGLQFLDLIQEGNVGLMKAVEKYDYRRGNRFSTYATWWIRQAVTRALANHGRTIRIPAHLGGRISKLYQVAQELEQEYGRQPTAEEIAESMELPAERVRWMLRTSRQPVHLERPVGDESDAELGDFIEDVEAPPPAEAVAQQMLTEELGDILDQLTPREARILRLRYGLQDGESRTLKEVGEMFGLSRERIRQLEKEALRKLRHPNFAGHLRQYLN